MAAPAEMAHADEALKSLVSRFRDAPSSPAFTDLAAALLARGHASEALRVAEHGLQLMPTSVEGRIERAAALLALGRPRVAYVELKRALALSPTHRRALRLLGKTYIDAGVPGKAAELLAQRSRNEHTEEETTHVTPTPYGFGEDSPTANMEPRQGRPEVAAPTRRPPDRDEVASAGRAQVELGRRPAESGTPGFPDLFSDLTRDLGLSVAAPERPQSRVEVTQVIRRRGGPPSRHPSGLEAIDGPIIDTTQPGQISEISGDLGVPPLGLEPAPLSDAVTSPRMTLSAISLDDEPLFQENMPFAVRPVIGASEGSDAANDLRETIDEEHPPELASLMNTIDADTASMALANPNEPQGNTQVDELELDFQPMGRGDLPPELPIPELPPLIPEPRGEPDTDSFPRDPRELREAREREPREPAREREAVREARERELREREARERELREREARERELREREAREREAREREAREREAREREAREREAREREAREREAREREAREREPREPPRERPLPPALDTSGDPTAFRAPPLLEIARPTRRGPQPPRLEVVEPKTSALHVGLAIAGLVLMLLYVAGLALITPDVWKRWTPASIDKLQRNGDPSASGSRSSAPEANDRQEAARVFR